MARDPLAGWKLRLQPVIDARASTPVHVIVWGPHDDDKRQAIIDHLRAVPHTEVATPEELLAAMPELSDFGDDVWYQEEIQATSADLVLCLIKNGPTGAPAEITKFKDHADIAPKVRVLRPKILTSPEALLTQAVKKFPAAQSMSYTPAQLVTCVNMRSMCGQWLQATRIELHRRGWRAAHPVL